jgi:hypothetical protein
LSSEGDEIVGEIGKLLGHVAATSFRAKHD